MARKNDRTTPGAPSPALPSAAIPLRAAPAAASSSGSAGPPPWDLRLPGGLIEDLRQLRSQFDKVDRVTGNILYKIEEKRKQARREMGLPSHDEVDAPRPSRRIAPAWIDSLWTHRNPDGTIEVVINGRQLVLRPHLGALFIVLAEDAGVSDDAGIGYKALDEIARRMATLTGGRVLPDRTINKYIWKLRQELIIHAKLTADVIQRRYRFGCRLAIQRGKLRRVAPGTLQAPRPAARAAGGFAER